MTKSESPADVAVIGSRSLYVDGVVSVIGSLGYRVAVAPTVGQAGAVSVVVLLSTEQVPRSGCVAGRKVIALFPEMAATCRGVDVHLDPWASREVLTSILVKLVRRQNTGKTELSAGERRVVAGYATGSTRNALAAELFLSPGTVSTHLQRSREKYRDAGRSAGSKVELLMRAIEDGIIECPCRNRDIRAAS